MTSYYANTNMNYSSVADESHNQHNGGAVANPNQQHPQSQQAPLQSQQLHARALQQQQNQQGQMMPPQQLNYAAQTQQMHPNHYEPRFYPLGVIMPQQPIQQPFYEAYPVNNYLLFPPYQYNQQYKDVRQPMGGPAGAAGAQGAPNSGVAATGGLHQPGGHPIQVAHHDQLQQHVGGYPGPDPHNPSKQDQNVIYAGFIERLRLLMPTPPLLKTSIRPDLSFSLNQKRAKRRSKFTKEQDDLIVSLKRKGKSWVEIAELSKVGLYLAARNRYQVIVGQQGNNNSLLWLDKDKDILRSKLDEAEVEKWRFLAVELNKATGKEFTASDCREVIRELFFKNPLDFSVNEMTVQECEKECKITEKAVEQEGKSGSSQTYVNLILGSGNDANGGSRGNSTNNNNNNNNTNPGNNNNAVSDPAARNGVSSGVKNEGRNGRKPNNPVNHFKQNNPVFDQNVPYGYNEEYHSLRSSQEPIEGYKLNQNNYY